MSILLVCILKGRERAMLRIFVMLIIVRQGPLDNRSNVIIGISHLLIHYITLNCVFLFPKWVILCPM